MPSAELSSVPPCGGLLSFGVPAAALYPVARNTTEAPCRLPRSGGPACGYVNRNIWDPKDPSTVGTRRLSWSQARRRRAPRPHANETRELRPAQHSRRVARRVLHQGRVRQHLDVVQEGDAPRRVEGQLRFLSGEALPGFSDPPATPARGGREVAVDRGDRLAPARGERRRSVL
jgi:hypothetical protein